MENGQCNPLRRIKGNIEGSRTKMAPGRTGVPLAASAAVIGWLFVEVLFQSDQPRCQLIKAVSEQPTNISNGVIDGGLAKLMFLQVKYV